MIDIFIDDSDDDTIPYSNLSSSLCHIGVNETLVGCGTGEISDHIMPMALLFRFANCLPTTDIVKAYGFPEDCATS